MIVYLLNIGKTPGNWNAVIYEFQDDTGTSLTRTHIYKTGPRMPERFVTWSVTEMEHSYGAKKGDHPNRALRGAFGDMTGTALWRRVTKCQFRAFLKKNGVTL